MPNQKWLGMLPRTSLLTHYCLKLFTTKVKEFCTQPGVYSVLGFAVVRTGSQTSNLILSLSILGKSLIYLVIKQYILHRVALTYIIGRKRALTT